MDQASESIASDEGRIVRQRRQALGWTQIKLAQFAEVNLSTVTLFEKGHQRIKPSTFAKIQAALADAEAGTRTTAMLRAQAGYSLIPPAVGTPERAEWEQSFLDSSPAYLSVQVAQLRQENARLSEHIKVLEKMNALLQQAIETYQKITEIDEEQAVITAAAIAALEKSVPQKSPEAKSLLRYRKMLLAR